MTTSPPPRTRTKLNGRGALVGPQQIAEQEQARELIAAAPVELVERDGRTFELRRLPDPAPPQEEPPEPIQLLSHRRGFPVA